MTRQNKSPPQALAPATGWHLSDIRVGESERLRLITCSIPLLELHSAHSSEITFLARSPPPGQFGEEQVMKGPSYQATPFSLSLSLSLSSSPLSFTPPHSSSLHPGSPDAELCEPRQREQPRNPCQGAQLWHHHPGKGEDPGRGVQEHALLTATTGCGHGSRWGCIVCTHTVKDQFHNTN